MHKAPRPVEIGGKPLRSFNTPLDKVRTRRAVPPFAQTNRTTKGWLNPFGSKGLPRPRHAQGHGSRESKPLVVHPWCAPFVVLSVRCRHAISQGPAPFFAASGLTSSGFSISLCVRGRRLAELRS
jgi:hypothetical protein